MNVTVSVTFIAGEFNCTIILCKIFLLYLMLWRVSFYFLFAIHFACSKEFSWIDSRDLWNSGWYTRQVSDAEPKRLFVQ